ncbi:MAG: two-component sensor histidine kinase, partial [Umezawaea sp.]
MNPRQWWFRRTLRFRITVVATGVAWLCLMALTSLAPSLIARVQISAVDSELTKAVALGSGPAVRVLDTAGGSLDGLPAPDLTPSEVRTLKSGKPVLREDGVSAVRWQGRVDTAPDGTPRLIVAGDTLIGYNGANDLGTKWLAVATALVALLVGIATWLSVRSSLRPVERMRVAATKLPRGERL